MSTRSLEQHAEVLRADSWEQGYDAHLEATTMAAEAFERAARRRADLSTWVELLISAYLEASSIGVSQPLANALTMHLLNVGALDQLRTLLHSHKPSYMTSNVLDAFKEARKSLKRYVLAQFPSTDKVPDWDPNERLTMSYRPPTPPVDSMRP